MSKMLKIAYIYCVVLLVVPFVHSNERKLQWSVNPGCGSSPDCDKVTLVHVAAKGPRDVLHHIWGFVGRPALLIALTKPGVNLTVDWDKLLFGPEENSLHFSEEPHYSFGLVLNRLLEFRDVNDTATLDDGENIFSFGTEYFQWDMNSLSPGPDGSVTLQVSSSEYINNQTTRAGNISISLTGYGQDGHGSQLPHLLHSANCSQIEITLEGLETSPQFEGRSRFAVELLVASSEESQNPGFSLIEHRSLDDEHTPGVFTVVDLLSPRVVAGDLGGFLQWRPVAYTEPARQIETSTEVKYYNVYNTTVFNNTLLFAFYGYELPELLLQSLNVSFGVSEDGFYNASNYLTWSLTFGHGQPPAEHLSLLVMLVLGIGLGVPAVLILGGGIYMVLCRHARTKDDLLLGQ